MAELNDIMLAGTVPIVNSAQDIQVNGNTFQPPIKGNTIVLMGDSLTALNINTSSNATDGRGAFTKLNIMLNQRFNVINYAGVGGETSADMLARFDADVVAFDPDYVWIHPGANDIGSGNLPAAATISNTQAMIDKAIAAGIVPIVCSTLPRGEVVATNVNGLPTSSMIALSQTALTKLGEINSALRNYVSANIGVILIDWASAFNADDTLANSTALLPRALLTYDGVHTNSIGSISLATFAKTILDPLIPARNDMLSLNTNLTNDGGDLTNIIRNGLMLGTLGDINTGATGTVADGWRAVRQGAGTIACACSKVARTDGIGGELQRCDISASGASSEVFRLDETINTPGIFADGDTILFEAEVFISNVVGVVSNLSIELTLSGGVSESHSGNVYNDSSDRTNTDFTSGVIRTLPIVIPAGTTLFVLQLQMGLPSGDTATVDWGRVRCWKVA